MNTWLSAALPARNTPSYTSIRAGKTDVILKVNKVAVETKSVRLAAGASEVVTFTVKKTGAATYTVEVGGQTGTFSMVQPLTPAAFSLSDLNVTPASVKVNEATTITVRVANTGETTGTHTVQLKLNGNVVESQDVTVEGLSSQLVTFSLSQTTVGTYQVAIGNLSGTLTVAEEKAAFPIGIIIGIVAAVVVVVGAALVYFLLKRTHVTVSKRRIEDEIACVRALHKRVQDWASEGFSVQNEERRLREWLEEAERQKHDAS